MTCPLCHGRKHVPIPNGVGFRRCKCVEKKIREIGYAAAGFPQILWDVTAEALRAAAWPNVAAARLPIKVGKRGLWWFHGPSNSRRRLYSIGLVMRAYLDDGRSVKTVRLRELIDAAFDADERRAWSAVVRNVDCLIVDCDGVVASKMVPTVLLEVYSARSTMRALTVFVSSDDIGEQAGKYGAELASVFERAVSIKRFSSPKGIIPVSRSKP